MTQFILTNIVMVSLGTIIYLMVRALPRIGEEISDPQKPGILDRWIKSGIPEKLDSLTTTYTGRIFRKLKIVLMRLDNYLTRKLKKINTDGRDKDKPRIDLGQVAESQNSEKVDSVTPSTDSTLQQGSGQASSPQAGSGQAPSEEQK